MMKRLTLIVAMLFIPALAKADSIVQVVMNPTTLPEVFDLSHGISVAGGITYPSYTETLGATFIWDTTTNVISAVQFVATGGPFFKDMVQGFTSMPYTVDFVNNEGAIFQMNSSNHLGMIQNLASAPGTYTTDLWYFCGDHCLGTYFITGTATVTSIGDGDHDDDDDDGDDPISTPEPGSLLLLVMGISALGFTRTQKTKLFFTC